MSQLEELVASLGVPAPELERALAAGTLLPLVAEYFLLPGGRRHDMPTVAEQAGLSVDDATRVWRALGLPEHPPDESVFTDADVEALRLFVGTMGTVSDYFVHEARVISGALARVAEVMVDEIWDTHFTDGPVSSGGVEALASGDLDMERVERLLMHLLRRQLVAAIYRRATAHQRPEGPTHAVGFADLVGYTALSQRLSGPALGSLIVDFERATHEIVTSGGGWIVKTIGDEVMFACADPGAAGDIALAMARTMPPELPPLRVAVAWGPVLLREGDCFGPTVNRAARLVSTAEPRQVVVDSELRSLLGDEFQVQSVGMAELKDLGRVERWELLGRR